MKLLCLEGPGVVDLKVEFEHFWDLKSKCKDFEKSHHSSGYGFIETQSGVDMFVHSTGLAGNPLKEGDFVSYDIAWDDQKH